MILKGNKCLLKPIGEQCLIDHTLGLNDPEIMKYSGISKTLGHTLESTMEWIDKINIDPNKRLFGIYQEENFLGNIRLDIDWFFRVGTISIVITDKSYHGKGIGTEAIQLLSDFAFNDLMLHKLEAGILEPNKASFRVFEKAGYMQEGKKRENRFINGEYVDVILMGRINKLN